MAHSNVKSSWVDGDQVFYDKSSNEIARYDGTSRKFTYLGGRRGEKSVTVSANKSLVAADAGIVQEVDTDAVVITLPATAIGLVFTIRNAGADGAVEVKVSPAAADLIQGNGFTAADNKDAINTKATAKKGDEITIIGDGLVAAGWTLHQVAGIWAREA